MTSCEAAFFDLDGTILALSSEKLFCYELCKERQVSLGGFARVLGIFLRYELGLVEDYEDLKRSVLGTILPNLSCQTIQARASLFFQERQEPKIRRNALGEIVRHRTAGRRLYLVSSTLDCLADPVGHYLGIESRFMTRLEVDDGKYTGGIAGDIYYGPSKATLLHQLARDDDLDLSRSFAYGDSIQDAPMLAAVGRPYAVNPDRRLRRLARERKWQVVDWT